MTITIKETEKANVLSVTWGNYDFDRPSLAVIALGLRDSGTVMWTVGGHVRFEQEEVGLEFDDLGIGPEEGEEGIWIWEGISVWQPGPYEYPQDGETELVGKCRRPTDEEWQAIREGRCPWDDEEWKLKEGAEG